MLLQYLRYGDPDMLDLGEAMARHRYDIDRGSGWQQYEKGYHGNREWIGDDKYGKRGYYSLHASHTWIRGLLLYWALTGDRRAYEAAEQSAQAFYKLLGESKGDGKVNYPEFRTPGWAIEACLAMYEYGGRKEYLAKAREIFNRTLLAMERDNGRRGHIIPGGQQSTQFVSYIIEPAARLHRLTGEMEIAAFLKRVLDWHRKEGVIFGDEKAGKYRPLRLVINWERARTWPEAAFTVTLAYGLQFADGYAYLHGVYGKKEDLEFGRKLFRDMMFYYGIPDLEVERSARCPLGYHFAGETQVWAAKLHAFTGRYGQQMLMLEQQRAGFGEKQITEPDIDFHGRRR